MKDFTIKDVAKQLAQDLLSQGIKIPPRSIQAILRGHFHLIDEIMARQGHDNMVMYNGDVTAIFKPYPKDNKPFNSKELMEHEFKRSKHKITRKVRRFAWKKSTSQKSPEELGLEIDLDPAA